MALGARPRARLRCPQECPKIEKYWKWEKKAQGCSRSPPFFHFQYFSISGPSRAHPNLLLYSYYILIIFLLYLYYILIILLPFRETRKLENLKIPLSETRKLENLKTPLSETRELENLKT